MKRKIEIEIITTEYKQYEIYNENTTKNWPKDDERGLTQYATFMSQFCFDGLVSDFSWSHNSEIQARLAPVFTNTNVKHMTIKHI